MKTGGLTEKTTGLKDLELSELQNFFTEIGEKKFRAQQVFRWLRAGARSFDEMSNVPRELRDRLKALEDAGLVSLGNSEILRVQVSASDGTRKYLFGLSDGNAVESVFMKYEYGNSICVSSQAGCRMGCRFCASTVNGLSRNLTPGEIEDQIISAERDTGERINHVVVMGTGEPFDNYGNVAKFIRNINDPAGLNIGMRNITVSTCGLIPGIERFGDDFDQVNLAISLHAPNSEKRGRLMPVNDAYPMPKLLEACRKYTEKTNRRVTFEYALTSGANDSEKDAEELAAALRGMLCHVNLIPLNEVDGTGLKRPDKGRIRAFEAVLASRGIPVTVRRSLGTDIDAACGQLRLKNSGRTV